ncbi:MAG TPA: T9SS type A sorting domain-containing protein, partial [Chitinispirillaceae bacterium]|nr:T9SS type A sorting domain-containing protein [Chitinispirillaceae bacterium]
TFMSHANNALKKGSVVIFNNQIHLDLPSRSITAIVIPVKNGVMTELSRKSLTEGKMVSLKRNLLTISGAHEFSIIDLNGRIIRKVSGSNTTDLKNLSHGIYMVYLKDCSGNKLLFQR